jgi:hypothetical protein
MMKHLLTIMEEIRVEIKAGHEELVAIMQAGHRVIMAKTDFFASQMDVNQAKTEAKMGVRLEETKGPPPVKRRRPV